MQNPQTDGPGIEAILKIWHFTNFEVVPTPGGGERNLVLMIVRGQCGYKCGCSQKNELRPIEGVTKIKPKIENDV